MSDAHSTTLPLTGESDPLPPFFIRAQFLAFVVGLGALALWVIGWLINSDHAIRSYLYGWLIFTGVSMGGLVLLMIGHLTGGDWGLIIRRPAEAAAMMIPVMGVAFLPIFTKLSFLFPWASKQMETDHVLQARVGAPFFGFTLKWFIVRWVVYFGFFGGLAYILRTLSLRHDKTGNPWMRVYINRLCCIGMVSYLFLITLAAIDWIAAREPHWYSTIIGIIIGIGQTSLCLSLIVALLYFLLPVRPFNTFVRPQHLNGLGNLLLTLTILWAYTNIAQLLVTYQGNLKEDVAWYIHRGLAYTQPNGWRWVALGLLVLHFFTPFFLLLIRSNKRAPIILSSIALGIFAMRWVDLAFWVVPSPPDNTPTNVTPGSLYWTDFVAPFAIGGIWFFVYVIFLRSQSLFPRPDAPVLPASDPATGQTFKPNAAH